MHKINAVIIFFMFALAGCGGSSPATRIHAQPDQMVSIPMMDPQPAFSQFASYLNLGDAITGEAALADRLARHPDLGLWWFRELLAANDPSSAAVARAWLLVTGEDALIDAHRRVSADPLRSEAVAALVAGHRLVDRGLVPAAERVLERLNETGPRDVGPWLRDEIAWLTKRCGGSVGSLSARATTMHSLLLSSADRVVVGAHGAALVVPSFAYVLGDQVTASERLQVAEAALDAGLPQTALRLAVRAGGGDPASSRLILARAFLALGEGDDALAAARRVIDPIERAEYQALALELLGRTDQAHAIIKRALGDDWFVKPVAREFHKVALMAVRYALLRSDLKTADQGLRALERSPGLHADIEALTSLYRILAEPQRGGPNHRALAKLRHQLYRDRAWPIAITYQALFDRAEKPLNP